MPEAGDLFAAIQKGDAARAAAILDAEPALASARRLGASALLIARYHGRHDIVALLRARLPALDVFEAAAPTTGRPPTTPAPGATRKPPAASITDRGAGG